MNSRMWALLKQYIREKNSHGKNELLEKMVDIEITNATTSIRVRTDKDEQ